MPNELTDWIIAFMQTQIPTDGTKLVFLFLGAASAEPAKARIIRAWAFTPIIMVSLGYGGLLFTVLSARYYDDSDTTYVAIASIALPCSLWCTVSGMVSALVNSPRLGPGSVNISRQLCSRCLNISRA